MIQKTAPKNIRTMHCLDLFRNTNMQRPMRVFNRQILSFRTTYWRMGRYTIVHIYINQKRQTKACSEVPKYEQIAGCIKPLIAHHGAQCPSFSTSVTYKEDSTGMTHADEILLLRDKDKDNSSLQRRRKIDIQFRSDDRIYVLLFYTRRHSWLAESVVHRVGISLFEIQTICKSNHSKPTSSLIQNSLPFFGGFYNATLFICYKGWRVTNKMSQLAAKYAI